jgi:hypothetical protein
LVGNTQREEHGLHNVDQLQKLYQCRNGEGPRDVSDPPSINKRIRNSLSVPSVRLNRGEQGRRTSLDVVGVQPWISPKQRHATITDNHTNL